MTPRFIPSCTDELMGRLKEIQRDFDLPVQSHLSENQGEIAWVKELCPWSEFYGDAYDHFGLFGGGVDTVMAHCVWPPEAEIARMKEQGRLRGPLSPEQHQLILRYRAGAHLSGPGYEHRPGTDVAGGTGESVFRAMGMRSRCRSCAGG